MSTFKIFLIYLFNAKFQVSHSSLYTRLSQYDLPIRQYENKYDWYIDMAPKQTFLHLFQRKRVVLKSSHMVMYSSHTLQLTDRDTIGKQTTDVSR